MADTVRHARGKDDYYGQPSRSAQLAAAITEPAKKSPARKDPDWCKTAHGPHQPAIIFSPYYPSRTTCLWPAWFVSDQMRWLCYHREICEACGKVLRDHVEVSECPDYDAAGYDEALAKATANHERVMAQRAAHPKPVITGRQGYRKRKSV